MIFNQTGSAGGGGTEIKLVSVTCQHSTVYYTDENMTPQVHRGSLFETLCPSGTIIFGQGPLEPEAVNVGIVQMGSYVRQYFAYRVTG